ncbi:hypothetical protein EPN18_02360 [bacterium]|nr:MAG: hypothetical protein EPN18_02360 [bacterium]
MTDAKTEKTELKKHLCEIINFMIAATKSFDIEFHGEARRLSACILTLVYDTDKTESLLGRLGLKNIDVYDEATDFNPKWDLPFSGLAIITLGGKTQRYVPRLQQNIKFLDRKAPLNTWWNKVVIAEPANNVRMTREDVVLDLAGSNTGIADGQITGLFEAVMEKEKTDWKSDRPIRADMLQLETASVRQIAYELLKALHDHFPEYYPAEEEPKAD